MKYILEHTVLFDNHFSWLHLIAIVVMLGVMWYCHKKVREMKDREKDLEDAISAKFTDESMQ